MSGLWLLAFSKSDWSFLLVVVVFAIAAFSVWHRMHPKPNSSIPVADDAPTPEDAVSVPPSSPPPTFSSELSLLAAKPLGAKGTPREQRHVEIAARLATGRCLYCDAPAVRSFPVPSLSKWVVDPATRWKVRSGSEAGKALCESHYGTAMLHAERSTRRSAHEYADFIGIQNDIMQEFATYGLDELMCTEAARVKAGKAKASS